MAVEIPVTGGVIRGHPDGIMSRQGSGNVLFDVKSMNTRAFAEWRRVGTEKKSPQYVDQLHVYAAGIEEEIDKLAVVGVCKDNCDMRIDIFDYSIEKMLEIRARAAEKVRARGIRSVRGGKFILSLAEIKSSRFDSSGLGKSGIY